MARRHGKIVDVESEVESERKHIDMARKAIPTKSKLRAAFSGPPGSGKSWTSLQVATELIPFLKDADCCQGNGRIAVLETERNSIEHYAKENEDDDYGFDFDIEPLRDFSPESYMEGLYRLDREGYTIIIVDQITNEWSAKGGMLDIHGKIVSSKGEKYNYFAWRDVTPRHDNFVESLMSTNAHLICNIRAKTKYIYESGKIENVGVKPIQRKDLDYQFDIFAMLDMKHTATFRKSRCPGLDGKKFDLPGRNVAEILAEWMLRGVGKPRSPEATLPYAYIKEIKEYQEKLGFNDASLSQAITKRGIASGKIEDISVEIAMDIVRVLRDRMLISNNTKTITDSLDKAAQQNPDDHGFAIERASSSNGVVSEASAVKES